MSEQNDHHDEALSALYRKASREEPSAELDRKILAMAKREQQAHHRRWGLSLATAAVVVLGLTITLRLLDHASAPPMPAVEEAPSLSAGKAKKGATEVAPDAEQRMERRERSLAAPAPAARAKSAPELSFEPPAPPLEATMEGSDMRDAFTAPAGVAQEQTTDEVAELPEPWLKRIEALVERGEVDKARQEMRRFRSRYPDYELPQSLRPLAVHE